MVQGIDRIRFTLPTQYDGNQNEGIQIGYVKVSVNGGGMQDFVEWGLGNNYNELDENIRIKTFFDGECFIYTNGRSKFIVHPNYEIKISRDKFKVMEVFYFIFSPPLSARRHATLDTSRIIQ